MNKLTMSVAEIANLLGVGTTTIYMMARQNEIPHKRLRGRIVFHYPTIEKWLANESNNEGGDQT